MAVVCSKEAGQWQAGGVVIDPEQRLHQNASARISHTDISLKITQNVIQGIVLTAFRLLAAFVT